MNTHTFGDGVFPDVCLLEGQGWLVVRSGDTRVAGFVTVYQWPQDHVDRAAIVYQFEVPASSPAFPRVYATGGEVWVFYHDGTIGHLHNLMTGWHQPLAPCQNNDPGCFGAGYFAWQGAADHNWPISRLTLATKDVAPAGFGAGTGLSRVLADGRVVTVDEDRRAVDGMTRPCFADGLIVGEGPRLDNTGVVWDRDGDRGLLWETAEGLTPRCATEGQQCIVTTWGTSVLAWAGLLSELPVAEVPEPPVFALEPPIVTVDRWTLDDVLEGREFRFHDTGNPELQQDIRVWVEGGSMYASWTNAAGSAQTHLQRIVHPCSGDPGPIDPPDPVDPPMGMRPVSFGPNLGTDDFCILFTEDNLWPSHVGLAGFHFYGQNVLDPAPIVGPNTYENLKNANAFRKCKDWGLTTEMELAGGPDQAYQGETKIAAAGGRLDLLAYDGAFKEIAVADFAAWVKEYRQTHPRWVILVYAAFPMVSTDQILERFAAWKALGARPDALRMDIDPGLTSRFTATDFARLRAFCDAEQISFQYVVNAVDGLTSAEYCRRAWQKHQTLEAMGHWDGRIVQSWAEAPDHTRKIPQNLREGAPEAFTTLLRDVLLAHEPIVPPAPPVVKLTTDRQIFRREGEPWRWKGVTAFKLARLFADGQNIDAFLAAYAGFNVLRVFDYAVVNAPGFQWESPTISQTGAFLDYVNARGFAVELVLLTDDNRQREAHANDLVKALAWTHPGLLMEIGNEPNTNKSIDTSRLRGPLEASGLLFSSGDYDDSPKQFGPFLTYHSARDSEWPRKAHDAIEYYGGGGPNAPTDPAHHTPAVADEPIRPDQCNPAWWDMEQDFTAYFATASLLGAGGTFHSETGKYGALPTELERRMIAAALRGLNQFPADAPISGSYERIDEHGATLRTYKVGPHIVRIRPTDGIMFP